MTETTRPAVSPTVQQMLSKVPEVTVWFWMIKVLCTTVGESFADWISLTVGLGLTTTTVIFTVLLVAVLTWQMSLRRYVPFVYWLTVVVLSVTGTLYTDTLTDALGVPLSLSANVFTATLALVFGIWWTRERTLSIHSIVTTPREAFYWLAVLVTFALGTAIGDWTLELTGWSAGVSVLLPVGLIAAITLGWRLGANPVLSFWLAYILTRPLGANLGDWLARSRADGGAGLGTATTSLVFLVAILATVAYLSIARADVIGNSVTASRADRGRERLLLGYFGVIAAATAALLVWAAGQPHTSPALEDDDALPAAVALEPPPGQPVAARFPAADTAAFAAIVTNVQAGLAAGNHSSAVNRITDLETAWDEAEDRLKPMDPAGWELLDAKIDRALKAVRTPEPDPDAERDALTELSAALR